MTTTALPTLDQLADDLAEANNQLKAWEDRRRSILDQLEQLHDAGMAPEKFTHNGFTYSRQAGRITYDWSEAPDVIAQQERLKEVQEIAKALNLVIAKAGAPTWRVTTSKA